MKQCPGCKTIKKADNCMMCAIKKVSKFKKEIKNILDMPKREYQKLEIISNYLQEESEYGS